MKSFFILLKKEFLDWFLTPMAFVYMSGFLFLSHWLFLHDFFVLNDASLQSFFMWVPFLWVAFLPLLTMNQFVLEKKQNTIELLQTLPVSFFEIVMAKFFACVLMVFTLLIFTMCLVLSVSRLGNLEWGVVAASYFGLVLWACFALSFGLVFSKILNSFILAFLLTFLGLFVFYSMAHPLVTQNLPLSWVSYVESLSLDVNLQNFLQGFITSQALIYFLSGTLLFLSFLFFDFRKKKKIILTSFLLFVFLFHNQIDVFKFSLDLTTDQEHTLSQQSKTILNRLQDRVVVRLYFSKDLPPQIEKYKSQILAVLNDFKMNAKEDFIIQYENVESEVEQEKARQLGIEPLMMSIKSQNQILTKEFYLGLSLQYQDKMDVFAFVADLSHFEYKMALSLLKLATPKLPQLGLVLSGSQESYSVLKEFLEELADVFILDSSSTWSDFDLVWVIDPKNTELKLSQKILKALQKNVPVMVFLTQTEISEWVKQKQKQTGLEKFLQRFGITVSQELLLDADHNYKAQFHLGSSQVTLDYPFWLQAQAQNLNFEHPVTSGLEELFLPWTHALLQKPIQLVESKVLVKSSQDSFLQEPERLSISPQYVSQMQSLPKVQSYPVAMDVQHKNDAASLFVMANTHILKNDFLNVQSFPEARLNTVFLANLIEYKTWGDQLIQIRSRGKTNRPLTFTTTTQKNIFFWFILAMQILLPLMAIGFAKGLQLYRHQCLKKEIYQS